MLKLGNHVICNSFQFPTFATFPTGLQYVFELGFAAVLPATFKTSKNCKIFRKFPLDVFAGLHFHVPEFLIPSRLQLAREGRGGGQLNRNIYNNTLCNEGSTKIV